MKNDGRVEARGRLFCVYREHSVQSFGKTVDLIRKGGLLLEPLPAAGWFDGGQFFLLTALSDGYDRQTGSAALAFRPQQT